MSLKLMIRVDELCVALAGLVCKELASIRDNQSGTGLSLPLTYGEHQ